MSLIAWIVLGLVSGAIASRVVTGRGAGFVRNVVLGVVGAVVGGGVFHLVGERGVTGVNPWSMFVSVIGAVLVLFAYRAATSRSPEPLKFREGVLGSRRGSRRKR